MKGEVGDIIYQEYVQNSREYVNQLVTYFRGKFLKSILKKESTQDLKMDTFKTIEGQSFLKNIVKMYS